MNEQTEAQSITPTDFDRETWVVGTPVSPGRAPGWYTRIKTGSGSSPDAYPTQNRIGTPTKKKKAKRNSDEKAASIYAVRTFREEAIKALKWMKAAADEEDKIELGSEGSHLVQALRLLWAERGHCSEEWGEIVNFVQCSLAGEVIENLTGGQCAAIRSILEERLTFQPTADDSIATVATLEKAGFDPLHPLSGLGE